MASQIDTQLDERGRSQECRLFESEMRCASPEPVFRCDGWCEHSDVRRPSIVGDAREPWAARHTLGNIQRGGLWMGEYDTSGDPMITR